LYQPSTDTFVFTDLTASAIPALMATGLTTTSVALYLDSTANPGAVRDMFVLYNDGGTDWSLYKWGNYLRMGKWSDLAGNVPLGTFANSSDALPSTIQVTGSYVAGSQVGVTLISRSYVTGGIRLTFQLDNPQFLGQMAKVIGFWGTKNTTLPNNAVATLTASSHGTITSNVIYNLVPDGTTQFQVTWLAETDGISNFDSYKLILVAYVQ
jgi:hypothetical protein